MGRFQEIVERRSLTYGERGDRLIFPYRKLS
jgi:hypothetical protein